MKQLSHDETNFKSRKFPVVLLLDNITGEANIGSIFRLADAFNIEKIIFTGTSPNLKSNRLKKTSRSTHKTVNSEIRENGLHTAMLLKEQGLLLYALEITSESIPVHQFEYERKMPVCLVLGNEISGINKDLLQLCHKSLHINMYGKNSSMNVAHAAGIALYEITKTILALSKK